MAKLDEEVIDPSINDVTVISANPHHSTDEEDEAREKREKKHHKAEVRKSRQPASHDGELNIIPLLDAFTIILVFLIKSVASDPTQITNGDDVKLPVSTILNNVPEAVPLVISKKGILVNSVNVVKIMEDGTVDPTERSGNILPRVAEALKKEADHHKMIARFNSKVKFEGLLLVVADKNTKFTTLTDVLYTAGQVEFGQFKFAVLKNE